MKKITSVIVSFVLFVSIVSIGEAEVVYDKDLIPGIEFADAYNSVMSNLLINYWDDAGDFSEKETGLWKGDWMGDSHINAVESLVSMFNDDRLLSKASGWDRFETRRDILCKVNKTIDYTIYALNKMPAALRTFTETGEFGGVTRSEIYAALSGGFSFAAGYEMGAVPEYLIYAPRNYPSGLVRWRYHAHARNYADLLLEMFESEDVAAAIKEVTHFNPGWGASFGAWMMLRIAQSDISVLDKKTDMQKATAFIHLLETVDDDHSEEVKAYLLFAELTGDSQYLNKAIAIGEATHLTPASNLSDNLRLIDIFLSLYSVLHQPEYLEHARSLFDYILATHFVDDPLHPGFKIMAHDKKRADYVKSGVWPVPEWNPDNIGTKYPACTGCNHNFCYLLYRYNALADLVPNNHISVCWVPGIVRWVRLGIAVF